MLNGIRYANRGARSYIAIVKISRSAKLSSSCHWSISPKIGNCFFKHRDPSIPRRAWETVILVSYIHLWESLRKSTTQQV